MISGFLRNILWQPGFQGSRYYPTLLIIYHDVDETTVDKRVFIHRLAGDRIVMLRHWNIA